MTQASARNTTTQAPASPILTTPSLYRRMACWLYEGMLLFGVVFMAGYLFRPSAGSPSGPCSAAFIPTGSLCTMRWPARGW